MFQGAPSDIVQLNRALTARIAVSKRTNTSAQYSTSQKAAERLEADADDDEFIYKSADEPCGQDEPDTNCTTDKENESTENDRLEQTEQKTEESNVDNDTKALKRKEPAEDGTQSKRQCPEILIE